MNSQESSGECSEAQRLIQASDNSLLANSRTDRATSNADSVNVSFMHESIEYAGIDRVCEELGGLLTIYRTSRLRAREYGDRSRVSLELQRYWLAGPLFLPQRRC